MSFITLNFCHFSNCHLLNSLALVVVVVKTFCQIVMVQLLSRPFPLSTHINNVQSKYKTKSASEFINPRKKTNKYENNFDLWLEGIMRKGKERRGNFAIRVVCCEALIYLLFKFQLLSSPSRVSFPFLLCLSLVFHFKIASFVELLKRLIEAERKIQSVHPHMHVCVCRHALSVFPLPPSLSLPAIYQ